MSDSDSSAVSSTYHSDEGDVVPFMSPESITRGYVAEHETITFPQDTVTTQELKQILLHSTTQTGFHVYPASTETFLLTKHMDIVRCLKGTSPHCSAFIYGPGFLTHSLDEAIDTSLLPPKVLGDAVVFSASRATLLLTFTQGGVCCRTTDYNSQVTKSLIRAMERTTQEDVSIVHGVIDKSQLDENSFRHKLAELENTASPQTLDMDEDRFQNFVMGFLDCLRLSQKSDVNVVSPMQSTSASEKNDISQSPIDESSYGTSSRQELINKIKERDLQIETLEQKIDALHEEMEKIKQENLTEVRMDLWLRERRDSPTIPATSGYGTATSHSESDSDRMSALTETLYTEGVKNYGFQAEDDDILSTKSTKDTHVKHQSILHRACADGKLDFVKLALLRGEDITKMDVNGRTPVFLAVFKGHIDLVHFLAKDGCDLSVVDTYGYNILHIASLGGSVDMVDYILSNKIVDMESRGQYGRTAVMVAAGRGQRGVVEFLENKGCDLSKVDNEGDNILHVACIEGSVDMVEYILSKEIVDIDSQGQYDRTAAMVAADNGHRRVFEFLESKECDMSKVDANGDNILHVACLGGRMDMVEYILSQKLIDIESTGYIGRTAVMTAGVKGHIEVVKLLESKGCDLSAVDSNGDNILHVSCAGGSVDMVEYILSKKIIGIESRGQYGRTAVMKAAGRCHIGVFELLQSKGCDLSAVDSVGNNILHVASLLGSVDMVKYILSRKIVGIDSRGGYGRTAVMAAAEKSQRQVVELLQRNGCNLSVLDDEDNNILHMVCLGGNVQLLEYLLEQDVADMNTVNRSGITPIELAMSRDHLDCCDVLLSRGSANE